MAEVVSLCVFPLLYKTAEPLNFLEKLTLETFSFSLKQ